VWLNAADLDHIAATGTHICHNCSSNFRLRSGVAPLNAFEQRGINTAIGLDEAGINDDRDMLQEMRMVLRAHRVPGMEDVDVPSPGQVLRMATSGGAATTPYGSHIGTLAVGKAADLVLMDWDKLAYPYLDPETPVLDAVLQRAKTDGVDLVMVAGEVVYEGGRFIRVDRDAALARAARICVEVRFDFGRKAGQGRARVFQNDWGPRSWLSIPKAAYPCPDMFSPHHLAKSSMRRAAPPAFRSRITAGSTASCARDCVFSFTKTCEGAILAHNNRKPGECRFNGLRRMGDRGHHRSD
jgi:Amidohydrolase family